MSMWMICSLQVLALSTTVIKAIQTVWKTSQPEHLGPDCVPVLRFLGMNLERVDAERSTELNLPMGSILLNQMEYIVEVLMKFEPIPQLCSVSAVQPCQTVFNVSPPHIEFI